jgi:hypothetical protein
VRLVAQTDLQLGRARPTGRLPHLPSYQQWVTRFHYLLPVVGPLLGTTCGRALTAARLYLVHFAHCIVARMALLGVPPLRHGDATIEGTLLRPALGHAVCLSVAGPVVMSAAQAVLVRHDPPQAGPRQSKGMCLLDLPAQSQRKPYAST